MSAAHRLYIASFWPLVAMFECYAQLKQALSESVWDDEMRA